MRPLFRFPGGCGPRLLLGWIGELKVLLPGALAGLNLRVVSGNSLAFEILCLATPERLALMIRSRLLHRTHANVSSFQFHSGVCHPLIVQQQFYQEKFPAGASLWMSCWPSWDAAQGTS